MTVIEMARELGKLIQQDERYAEYYRAKAANDADEELQQMIQEFNLKRMQLNSEMSKNDKDGALLSRLDDEIKVLYGNIMANGNMTAFNSAKDSMDSMLSQINMIITYSANGEDPATCPSEQVSCGGDCGSCGGCH